MDLRLRLVSPVKILKNAKTLIKITWATSEMYHMLVGVLLIVS